MKEFWQGGACYAGVRDSFTKSPSSDCWSYKYPVLLPLLLVLTSKSSVILLLVNLFYFSSHTAPSSSTTTLYSLKVSYVSSPWLSFMPGTSSPQMYGMPLLTPLNLILRCSFSKKPLAIWNWPDHISLNWFSHIFFLFCHLPCFPPSVVPFCPLFRFVNSSE